MSENSRGKSQLLPESAARRVLLVQAFETGREARQWSIDDRHWATRLARESWAGSELPAQAIAQRADHALQRLTPRHPAIAQALSLRLWNGRWTAMAVAIGLLAGLLLDVFGGTQHINLLAPPIWAVVLWNLIVYLLLIGVALLPSAVRERFSPRAWLASRIALLADARGPMQSFAQTWGALVAPVTALRVAMVMHLAAAALAFGMIGSLYVRGLVLDFRAGWQSTFLQAPAAQSVLNKALAPASLITRITVPDVKPLRVNSIEPPRGLAAPWVHLYAATLLLWVLLPRLALAAWAGVSASRRENALALPIGEPYFQQLLRELKGKGEVVWVLPHVGTPTPQAAQGLRQWLAAALGQDVHAQIAPPVAYGEELALPQSLAEPTMVMLLVDLATTPEADSHGRLLTAVAAAWPDAFALVLADTTEFGARFSQVPERAKERRALWRGVAARRRAGFVAVDLMQPDLEGAVPALQAAGDRVAQFTSGVIALNATGSMRTQTQTQAPTHEHTHTQTTGQGPASQSRAA